MMSFVSIIICICILIVSGNKMNIVMYMDEKLTL